MPDPNKRKIIPSKGPGVLDGLANYFKLIARLLTDRRVHPLLKILPVGTLVYMLVPDLVPGPVDDAMLIWLGTTLFVELCPPEVVDEHRANLERSQNGIQRATGPAEETQGEIIDAEYWEEPSAEDKDPNAQ